MTIGDLVNGMRCNDGSVCICKQGDVVCRRKQFPNTAPVLDEDVEERARLAIERPARRGGKTLAPDEPESTPIAPEHYKAGTIETIVIIEALIPAWDLIIAPHLTNVVKYIARYKHKAGIEDLKKAQQYLGRAISILEGEAKWPKQST